MGADLPAEAHKIAIVTIFLAIAGVSNWAALAYIHDIVGRYVLPFISYLCSANFNEVISAKKFKSTLCPVLLRLF
jgi:hypothetical protein